MSDEMTVGQMLPTTSRETGFPEWNRFAAVNDEFVAIHMDDDAGREAGLPGAIGMGLLQVAYLHNTVRDWLDGRGRIVNFACRFSRPNLRGQVVTSGGRVTAITERDGHTEAELELWTTDQDGNQLVPATCTVAIDRASGNHQRGS